MSSSRKQSSTPNKAGHLTELKVKLPNSNETLHIGDHVNYARTANHEQVSTGKLVDIVEKDCMIGNHKCSASPVDPKLVIKNDRSGKRAPYDADHIIGFVDKVPAVQHLSASD